MIINFDKHSLILNNEKVQIRSTSLHYFRTPGIKAWKDRLNKIKACGYNTIDLYFCWGYHSEKQGIYDFTGIKDLRDLLNLTVELGLYVIARPGPYINAELSAGGLPKWLFNIPNMILRNRKHGDYHYSPIYMEALKEWYSRIIPIINEYHNVIAFQIENEYSTNEAEPDYIQELYDLVRSMGIKVPIFHNDAFGFGLYSDIVNIYAVDIYPTINFSENWKDNPYIFQTLDNIEGTLREYCPNSPLFIAELQSGWFDRWKGKGHDFIRQSLGKEHINIVTKTALSQGITMFNHYMGCGGTSWSNLASAETYTSYDFASPISEEGIPKENYYKAKEINYFLKAFNLASTDLIQDSSELLNDEYENVFALLRKDNINNCNWLFARNLNKNDIEFNFENNLVSLKAFDMKILPVNLPALACNIDFCSIQIFGKIEKNSHEIIFLLLEDNTELNLSGFDNLIIEDKFEYSGIDNATTIKIKEINNKNLASIKAIKENKTTEFIFLTIETADKTWLNDHLAIIGGDFIYNNLSSIAIKEETTFKILDLSNSKTWKEKTYDKKLDAINIPLDKFNSSNCSPEIDINYDYSDWNIAENNLDCISNKAYDRFIWYKGSFNGSIDTIEISAKHCFSVYLNGVQLFNHDSTGLQSGAEYAEDITFEVNHKLLNHHQENQLTVLVENLGFDKGFQNEPDSPRGILKFKTFPEKDIEWRIRGNLTHEIEEWDFISSGDITSSNNDYLTYHTIDFLIDIKENEFSPLCLNIQKADFTRANIYLNGNFIGVYNSNLGIQSKFYLPEAFLENQNRISLVIWQRNVDYQKNQDYKICKDNVIIKIETIERYRLIDTKNLI